ncbi:hypothetical protein Poli38472_001569 [Pythium oligandrum]|uniref:MYB transcription factor n=1 Tax=Pythium oligandrum TaxID=41045 RepID=A0A8K1CW99_PYTOL|nr:hypothetical protein Poli38472_001569 [Pythium oligandrum]|eukprot:TMW69413.1 hypothetical protein Poli38472_001569 [Pythium oligandrum]
MMDRTEERALHPPRLEDDDGDTASIAASSTSTNDDDHESSGPMHRKYERKTKRFAWPDDLHRLFVAAIFDLGLKNASPKALLPFMQPSASDAGLTTEHLKSHLQKYRLNYDKSRAEFLSYYDENSKRNGKRRRRSLKSNESHTKFIFPINPRLAEGMCMSEDGPISPLDPSPPRASAGRVAIGAPVIGDHVDPRRGMVEPNAMDVRSMPPPPHSTRVGPPSLQEPMGYPPPLPPRPAGNNRLDRAGLLRLAQQNAAMGAMGGNPYGAPVYPVSFGTGLTPRASDGSVDLTDPQWSMLASLFSPQTTALTPTVLPPGMKEPFMLNEEASPDLQMQMHLAMQAQMNLHRQMLTRKVAVSQHYLNQRGAESRVSTANAMLERALQQAATLQQPPPASYQHKQIPPPRSLMETPTSRPSIQPGTSSSQVSTAPGSELMPTWNQVDIEMDMATPEEPNDLFSFLKNSD